ncbi:hypothetical protein JK359_36040 [Streptomyces actinomycinicus]|uniref:Uncharacterized protein n=1 Tax=Streptomyces actinomycinicus TaxID=1695166 RepID=A0A937ERM9_9ACTN|nr:hypothetical protein [Streptomyces actinomycinicus]MBL1087302.1 hypothetical protein [Streptomyces actinomycinicus]
MHTAIDTFKLVTVPSEATAPFSLALSAMALVVPLAVFPLTRVAAYRRRGPDPAGDLRAHSQDRQASP